MCYHAAQPSPYPHLTCKASLLQISVCLILTWTSALPTLTFFKMFATSVARPARMLSTVQNFVNTLRPPTSSAHVPPHFKTEDGSPQFPDRQSFNGGDYYLHALYTPMLYQVHFHQTLWLVLGAPPLLTNCADGFYFPDDQAFQLTLRLLRSP